MNSIPTRPVAFPFVQRIGGLLVSAMLVWSATWQASAQNYVWTTFAGRVGQTNGGDGVGTNAYFNQPTGGALDTNGNFYVPDEYNNAIRKVTPDGTVSTFAGKLGFPYAGTNDGTGTNARFTQPTNLTFDKNGNIWVVDTYAHTIRKITPAGVVTTVAGLGNSPGWADGTNSFARFNYPNGIAYDTNDDVLYVADGNNGAIRKVTQAGVVTTITALGQSQGELYYGVEQVAVSTNHVVYILDAWNSTIWTINTNGGNRFNFAGSGTTNDSFPSNTGTNNGTGSAARFNFPESEWFGPQGDLFVCDYGNCTMRKITTGQVVSTVGGQPGVIGSQDGTNAQFNLPEGIFVDPWNNLYVADTQNSTLRIGYAGPPVIVTAPQNLTVPAGSSPGFTVTAGGAAPRSAYQWKFNGTPLTNNAQISGAQSNILTISNVTSTNAGTYLVVVTNAAGSTNVSATLTLNQTLPVITWTNPASIIYGTPLGTNQLDATANVSGTFVYNPSNTEVLNVGTNALSVVFTPTDTVDYSKATDTVSLVVLSAPLSVTASNASRTYGQTNPLFTGSLIGVVNSDNITANYASAATTNSPVGTYAIVPTLMDPNNRLTNYTVASTNGTLTVGPAAPIVTWSNPASVIYGTPLGTNQLDATANVSGTFVYNPSNTEVLNVGTNALSVVFTPTDTVDYSKATDTVSLVVLSAPLSVTASNASRTYGQTNPLFTGSLIGVVNSDNITANYASAATTNSPAGTYSIVPTLVDTNSRLTNYTVASTNGTLTVTHAGLTITASNLTKVFAQTETFAGTEFSAAGLYNSDSVTNVLLASAGATNTAAVGSYPIVPSGATGIGLSNYTVAYVNGTLTVTAPTPVVIGNPVRLMNGTVALTFSGGDPGVSYRIQANSSFPNPVWTNLSTNLAGAGGLTNFTDLDASNYPARFYRTVAP